MKRYLAVFFISALMVAGFHGSSRAFLLGEETHGVKIKLTDEFNLGIRVRLQPRFDFGDTIKNDTGKSYDSENDLYFRRTRLEIKGHMSDNLNFALILRADKLGKGAVTDIEGSKNVAVHQVYVDYKISDAASLLFGVKKLPYTRIALTSSSKQLLIERPVYVEKAKKTSGFQELYQPMLMLHGKLADGVFKYNLAVADGFSNGDDSDLLGTGNAVQKSNFLYVGRIELSPPGWVEKKQSDAHLGKGRHLTLGASYAFQNGIEYKNKTSEEERNLWGLDISGHYEGFTAQAEYTVWKKKSDETGVKEVKPKGWYVQAGYFFKGPDIEPAARYEVYDHDSNKDDKVEKVTTLGVNWYPRGHSTKLSLNWVHHKYETNVALANDDSKDVYQLQAQIYF